MGSPCMHYEHPPQKANLQSDVNYVGDVGVLVIYLFVFVHCSICSYGTAVLRLKFVVRNKTNEKTRLPSRTPQENMSDQQKT